MPNILRLDHYEYKHSNITLYPLYMCDYMSTNKKLKVITPRDFHFKRTKLEQKLEEYKGTKHFRERTILHIL